jgi:capsular polysaccharide transport system permease protein
MSIDAQVSAGRDDFWAEFVRGAKRQSNVVLALIFKEYKNKLGRSHLGVVWVILSPLAKISLIATVWYLAGRTKIDGVNTLLFISMGYVPYLCVRRCMTQIPSAIRTNQQLLDYPQVKPIDTLIAKFILEFCLIGAAVCLLLLILWWFFDLAPPMPQPLEFAYVVFLALTMGFGMAMIFGVYGTLYEGLQRASDLLSRPLVFISCVLHPAHILPNSALEILKWNPVLQFVEYGRHYTLGTPLIAQADLQTPAIVAVASLGIGTLAYYANRFRLVYR